jgi:hypothetical protein
VLRKIESLRFLFFRHSQTNQFVHNLKQNERSHNSKHPGDCNAHELIQQLMRITLKQAGREHITMRVIENRIDHARSKNTREQRANRPARPVYAECVE